MSCGSGFAAEEVGRYGISLVLADNPTLRHSESLSKSQVIHPKRGSRADLTSRILVRMKLMLALLIANGVLLSTLAQSSGTTSSVKIVNLKPPNYPPIAIAARVTGEVDLEIIILENGKAGNVQVKSGPQMLREAAAESAKSSLFQPVGLRDDNNSYVLVYKFALESTGCSEGRDSSYPHVSYDSSTITISEKPIPICAPSQQPPPPPPSE